MKEWITKIGLAACALFCLTGLLNLCQNAVDHERMEAVCGEWIAVYPCSRLLIREQKGVYTLTFYRITPEGSFKTSKHRLRGGRSLHLGSGKNKTYIWLAEDGQTLQLVPGNCYRRKELSTQKTNDDDKKNRKNGEVRREPVPVAETE